MARTPEKPMYKMFDPAVKAYRSMDAETAKQFVASAKEVEAQLVEDGELAKGEQTV